MTSSHPRRALAHGSPCCSPPRAAKAGQEPDWSWTGTDERRGQPVSRAIAYSIAPSVAVNDVPRPAGTRPSLGGSTEESERARKSPRRRRRGGAGPGPCSQSGEEEDDSHVRLLPQGPPPYAYPSLDPRIALFEEEEGAESRKTASFSASSSLFPSLRPQNSGKPRHRLRAWEQRGSCGQMGSKAETWPEKGRKTGRREGARANRRSAGARPSVAQPSSRYLSLPMPLPLPHPYLSSPIFLSPSVFGACEAGPTAISAVGT
ncbi:hypothetical protein CDD83_3669 [Cordyceps sp. RAO-2017]|nr:hypothetical protein CDD83_3669 [Cordyceps sp. RAO-2017]